MKIIRIEKCGECPHVYPEDGGYDACYLLFEGDRVLVNYDTIHPDCPLEDAGELAELRAKAAKWDKLQSLFDTSCDKCFLGHVCGTHRRSDAVCEDIKEAIEAAKEE
jgi:hypothetical protein